MALKTSFPAPTGVAISSADSRRDLNGLVVRDLGGNPRGGLLRRSTTARAAGRGTMGIDVYAFEAVVVRNSLAAFITNDGTVTDVPVGPVPGANSVYSIVYVKQNESVSPFADPDDLPFFGYVQGTPSAIPSVAAAVALVPAGGLPLFSVFIPSTATTTLSAGVVINEIYNFTALTGAPIPARTKAELDQVTFMVPGQPGFTLDFQVAYTYNGGAWVPTNTRKVSASPGTLVGGALPSWAVIIEQSGIVSVSTGGAGDANIPYPTAFPNGVISVQLVRYDFTTYGLTGHILNTTQTLTQCNFRVYTAAGAALTSVAGVKYVYTAIGW